MVNVTEQVISSADSIVNSTGILEAAMEAPNVMYDAPQIIDDSLLAPPLYTHGNNTAADKVRQAAGERLKS
jgi:hypothetical protein